MEALRTGDVGAGCTVVRGFTTTCGIKGDMMTGEDLNEVRTIFIYEAARIAALAANAPVIPAFWAEREKDFQDQMMEFVSRQMGPDRLATPEAAHDSWVQAYLDLGWRWGEKYDPEARTHPDMVPYNDLSPLEKDKDAVFLMLCDIARLYIRGDEDGAT